MRSSFRKQNINNAFALFKQNKLEDALKLFKNQIELDKKTGLPDCYAHVARCYIKMKNFREALNWLQKMPPHRHKNHNFLQNLSLTYFNIYIGLYAQTLNVDHLKEAKKYSLKNTKDFHIKASILHEAKKTPELMKFYEEMVIKEKAAKPIDLINVAYGYENIYNLEKAEKVYLQLIEKKYLWQAKIAYATMLQSRQENYEKSIPILNQVVNHVPDLKANLRPTPLQYAQAYNSLAIASNILNKPLEETREYIKKGLKHKRDHAPLLSLSAKLTGNTTRRFSSIIPHKRAELYNQAMHANINRWSKLHGNFSYNNPGVTSEKDLISAPVKDSKPSKKPISFTEEKSLSTPPKSNITATKTEKEFIVTQIPTHITLPHLVPKISPKTIKTEESSICIKHKEKTHFTKKHHKQYKTSKNQNIYHMLQNTPLTRKEPPTKKHISQPVKPNKIVTDPQEKCSKIGLFAMVVTTGVSVIAAGAAISNTLYQP